MKSVDLFRLSYPEGCLYLKCPRTSLSEIKIHRLISSKFPDPTIPIKDDNEELNCIIRQEDNTLGQRLEYPPTCVELAGRFDISAEELSSLLQPYCEKRYDLQSSIPSTLIHGDFWLVNVGRRLNDKRLILFDFECSCVVHPFRELCISDIESRPQLGSDWSQKCGFVKTEETRVLIKAHVLLGWPIVVRTRLIVCIKTAGDKRPYVGHQLWPVFSDMGKNSDWFTREEDLRP